MELPLISGQKPTSCPLVTSLPLPSFSVVMSMLLAGGGIKTGQTIGATDQRGGGIKSRRLGPGDLAATVFNHLGIDPNDHWTNPSGRPTPLVESGVPIRELV